MSPETSLLLLETKDVHDIDKVKSNTKKKYYEQSALMDTLAPTPITNVELSAIA